jgi:hypothetical protein
MIDNTAIECTVCGDISDDTHYVDFFINPDGKGFCEKCVPNNLEDEGEDCD